jgi:transcriptional regulator with XRE-family HTH domain
VGAPTSVPKELKFLGANIRRERNSKAMTQEKLAELADLNIRTVQKIEAGDINILITTLIRLRKALGAKWENLLPR